MGLDNSYFVSQGIDPDAYYHTTRSHNAAKALEKMVAVRKEFKKEDKNESSR